jgi:hypothetical protein
VTKSENFMMRNILFAAIATLAVAFGDLAAANAAGDGSDRKLTGAEQAARQREADLIEIYVRRVAKTQGWDAMPPDTTKPAPHGLRPW